MSTTCILARKPVSNNASGDQTKKAPLGAFFDDNCFIIDFISRKKYHIDVVLFFRFARLGGLFFVN
jgi:hypothetical protein